MKNLPTWLFLIRVTLSFRYEKDLRSVPTSTHDMLIDSTDRAAHGFIVSLIQCPVDTLIVISLWTWVISSTPAQTSSHSLQAWASTHLMNSRSILYHVYSAV